MYDRQTVANRDEGADERAPQHDLGQEAARGQSAELQPDYAEAHTNDAIPMFLEESEDPLVKDVADGSGHKEIRYERTVKAHPTLAFADDDSMAVQAEGHAKELFASDGVLGDAETRLAGHESAVTLIKTGNAITVEGKTLHQVKPGLRSKGLDQAAESVANLTVDRCVGLAARIEGGSESSQTMVKRNEEGTTHEKINVGSADSDELNRLAVQISREVEDRGLGEDEELPKDLGSTYGRAALDPKFKAAAKKHGVNEHARPKVGEMLGIFSIFREAKKPDADPNAPILEQMEQRRDFTEEGPSKAREFSWGYHYAGVVATSPSGDDYVTLENYNRTSDMNDAMEEAAAEMVAAKGSKISRWWAKKKLEGQTSREQLETMIKDKVGRDPAAVKARLEHALDAKHGEAWYFAMYGSKEGQSFHEKNAASGYFANPLTVVTSSDDTRALKGARTYQRNAQCPPAVGGDAGGEVARIQKEWREAAKPAALANPTVGAMKTFDKGYVDQLVRVLAPDYWQALLDAVGVPEVSQRLADHFVSDLRTLNEGINRLAEVLSYREDGEALEGLAKPRIEACNRLTQWATTG